MVDKLFISIINCLIAFCDVRMFMLGKGNFFSISITIPVLFTHILKLLMIWTISYDSYDMSDISRLKCIFLKMMRSFFWWYEIFEAFCFKNFEFYSKIFVDFESFWWFYANFLFIVFGSSWCALPHCGYLRRAV